MEYRFLHLKFPASNTFVELRSIIASIDLRSIGISEWGVFHGVFGLATNELYWVLHEDLDASTSNTDNLVKFDDIVRRLTDADVLIIDQKRFKPTVRPLEHVARTASGVYVFRWFDVNESDVDEIAALSKEAWNTFEAGFDTEVQGLFAEAGLKEGSNEELSDGRETMLLVTWYRDLAVWQDSREPHPKARELFLKRHGLMKEAKPIATRLIPRGT
ncbi:MAG: hypothetical protein P8N51_07205 [Pseudomonadales bacterium]|nr:hypothetical protein [Pseudomonadales bacterium]MDG1443832.1 hypothetical protein [Pseudomonadales bacterium]